MGLFFFFFRAVVVLIHMLILHFCSSLGSLQLLKEYYVLYSSFSEKMEVLLLVKSYVKSLQ